MKDLLNLILTEVEKHLKKQDIELTEKSKKRIVSVVHAVVANEQSDKYLKTLF